MKISVLLIGLSPACGTSGETVPQVPFFLRVSIASVLQLAIIGTSW